MNIKMDLIPTYIIVCMCVSSCSIDKKIVHCCFYIDKIKDKKPHHAQQFLDLLLETYLLSFWPNFFLLLFVSYSKQ